MKGGLARLGSVFQDARTAHGVASVCAAVAAVVVAEGVTATIVMSDAEMESTTVTGEGGAARGIGERGAERGIGEIEAERGIGIGTEVWVTRATGQRTEESRQTIRILPEPLMPRSGLQH